MFRIQRTHPRLNVSRQRSVCVANGPTYDFSFGGFHVHGCARPLRNLVSAKWNNKRARVSMCLSLYLPNDTSRQSDCYLLLFLIAETNCYSFLIHVIEFSSLTLLRQQISKATCTTFWWLFFFQNPVTAAIWTKRMCHACLHARVITLLVRSKSETNARSRCLLSFFPLIEIHKTRNTYTQDTLEYRKLNKKFKENTRWLCS